jgi:hypothetical protein
MAVIQGVMALVSRSLGKVVAALFGWAVLALFGQTSPLTGPPWARRAKFSGIHSRAPRLFPRSSP